MRTIEYKIPYEKMITRIPGLFAYLESDEYGEVSLHSATDSPNGCYGKVVQNIKLKDMGDEDNLIETKLMVDGKTLLEEGKTYSFRTLIDYYYQYKDIVPDSSFILFMDKGIGKVKVDFEGVDNCEAAPEYVYLSTVLKLYDELVKMSKKCEEGQEERDKYTCCLCERYEKMGGDKFKDFIGDLIPELNNRSEYFLSCADSVEKMTLDLDVDLTSSVEDMGIMSCYVSQWIPYKKYVSGDKVFYDGKIWKLKFGKTEEDETYVIKSTGKFDEDLEKVVFDDDNFEPIGTQTEISIEINGQTDSKLRDLRRMAVYMNDSDKAEMPEDGEDWLFYYRKGLVLNISVLNDENGNILSLSNAREGLSEAATDRNDLLAYGDVITDITYNEENRTITFEYKQGVHLKAYPLGTEKDDDGNILYKWGNFEVDNTKNCDDCGITYTETYNYMSDSDLDKLISGEFTIDTSGNNVQISERFNFDDYINGEYDKKLKSYKFEFTTSNNMFSYSKMIAHQDAHITSIITDFKKCRDNYDEFIESDLMRYDYFNGISYSPTKRIDVNIQRGSTSVFQKHLAFSEIKTLEDMETYQNGSFFSMSE